MLNKQSLVDANFILFQLTLMHGGCGNIDPFICSDLLIAVSQWQSAGPLQNRLPNFLRCPWDPTASH